MDIVALISNFFGAVKELCGFAKSKRLGLEEYRCDEGGGVGAAEQAAKDKTAVAIKNEDVKEIRNEIAE
jgi:hypothetical protein